MLQFLKNLLLGGKAPAVDLHELLKEKNALVLDVRTTAEFAQGHGKGVKNIPLHELNGRLAELKKLDRPVVTCCRSGNRSGTAAKLLRGHGIEAYNGGSWQNVEKNRKG